MKIKVFILLISFAFVSFDLNEISNLMISDSKKLDGNNISAWFRNIGFFNRDPFTLSSGFEWPIGSGKHLPNASGIWITGKVQTDTLMAITSYTPELRPGFINTSGIPEGIDDPVYRIYKIIKGDTTSMDYLNWPVSQGAYLDSNNKPFLPGIQTLFFSMTDGYPESHVYTDPMKAQIQVTSWCYNSVSDPVISNTIFSEFKIINKNSSVWTDATISV